MANLCASPSSHMFYIVYDPPVFTCVNYYTFNFIDTRTVHLCGQLYSLLFTSLHSRSFNFLVISCTSPPTCVHFLLFVCTLFTPLVTFSHFSFSFGLRSLLYTSTVCSHFYLLCASLNLHSYFHLWFTLYTFFRFDLPLIVESMHF